MLNTQKYKGGTGDGRKEISGVSRICKDDIKYHTL